MNPFTPCMTEMGSQTGGRVTHGFSSLLFTIPVKSGRGSGFFLWPWASHYWSMKTAVMGVTSYGCMVTSLGHICTRVTRILGSPLPATASASEQTQELSLQVALYWEGAGETCDPRRWQVHCRRNKALCIPSPASRSHRNRKQHLELSVIPLVW